MGFKFITVSAKNGHETRAFFYLTFLSTTPSPKQSVNKSANFLASMRESFHILFHPYWPNCRSFQEDVSYKRRKNKPISQASTHKRCYIWTFTLIQNQREQISWFIWSNYLNDIGYKFENQIKSHHSIVGKRWAVSNLFGLSSTRIDCSSPYQNHY